jgi:hypothetical protein
MFSKLILCKLAGFEVQVTNNPLYPEPDMGETKIEKVKVNICRNPTIASSPNYEKSYTAWNGHTVAGYYKFRAMLDEYIKQAPLNNVNEWVNTISLLLSGTPLSYWQNVLSQLADDHIWDENLFQKALHTFVLYYCSSKA